MTRMWFARFVVAVAATWMFTAAAEACQGQKVLYEDRFATYDPSWGSFGAELTIEGGRMVIRPEAAMVYWQTNDLADYADVDLCVDLTILKSVVADEVLGGLVFWYVDDDNFTVFQVDTAGHASVFQRVKGGLRETLPWGDTDLVPMGDGKSIRLRVVTKGTAATIYINGKKFRDVTTGGVALPLGGSKVGLIAGSANTGVSTVAFDNFAVTSPN